MKQPAFTEHAPIYQQIMDYFIERIQSGVFAPGFQLPTVRAFAGEHNMAHGTVKHAYDLLEQQGYVEKAQGRGTFVCDMASARNVSKKDQGMAAIDDFLNRMAALGYTPDEIRIFLDLKLRGRFGELPPVRLWAVDCCIETVSVMARQIMELEHVDVREYQLGTILNAAQPFDPGLDLLVTTPTHFRRVEEKTDEDLHLARVVMAISRKTLVQLARIPENHQVGIACASERFAQIIKNNYESYDVVKPPPSVAYFGSGAALEELLHRVDRLILPFDYWRFASPHEQELIQNIQFAAPPILFDYRIEAGSLMFLEEEIHKIYQAKQQKYDIEKLKYEA